MEISFESDLNRHLVQLENPNKAARKRSLEELKDLVVNFYTQGETGAEGEKVWHSKLCRPLLKCAAHDDSERVRELAAETILGVLEHVSLSGQPSALPCLLPALAHRLALDSSAKEPSEEVRLLLIRIFVKILEKCVSVDGRELEQLKVKTHQDDMYQIIAACVQDNCPDVMAAGCEAVQHLAKALPTSIKFNASSSLLTPLLKALRHQQKRIRVASVKAIGIVIQSGTSSDLEGVAGPLAQRLFDDASEVRLAVAICAGHLLLTWFHAEANACLLVPLVLTCLEDPMPDIRAACHELWRQVGDEYLDKLVQRNENVKDKLDFGERAAPSHYPSSVIRPSFGCRQYMTSIFMKLLPAIKTDLQDWLPETRITASRLLIALLPHLEDSAVISNYGDALISVIRTGANDSEALVVANMIKSAEIYGYFVPPSVWCPLMLEHITNNPTSVELMILSNILSGCNAVTLRVYLEDLGLSLQSDQICFSRECSHLSNLMACCEALLKVNGQNCSIIQSSLFKIALSTLALSADAAGKARATAILDRVAELCQGKTELYRREMFGVLKTMRSDCTTWTAHSYRLQMFSTMLQEAGPALGYFAEQVVSIFSSVLAEGSKDPELQLRVFILLSKQLADIDSRLDSQAQFRPFAFQVLNELILPALVWHAGLKAAAVRTAASSSLWQLFHSQIISPDNVFQQPEFCHRLFATMNRLLLDEDAMTRLFVCKTYGEMFGSEAFKQRVEPLHIIDISNALLQRLDDVSDDLRIESLDTLSAIPIAMCDEGHQLHLCTAIMLHMDDANQLIRKRSLDCLIRMSEQGCSGLLLERLQLAKVKHQHREEIELLEYHLERISL